MLLESDGLLPIKSGWRNSSNSANQDGVFVFDFPALFGV